MSELSGPGASGMARKDTLKRELGIWSAASIVIGTVIGSGIFLVPKTMVENVGTPYMVLFVWIFGGVLSLCGALTYAELAAALPEAGGEYVFLREAYGPLMAYLYGWMQLWVGKAGSIATLATGFFLYLANFNPALESVWAVIPLPLGEHGGPLEIRYGQFMALGVIVILSAINYLGAKLGAGIQIGVTIVKVALIVAIIVAGLFGGQGVAANFHTSAAAPGGIAGFFGALVAALWAYDGWNNLSMVSSEISQPQRNLPRALILGTFAVVVIYVLMNCAYFFVLPAATVASTDRVASEMTRHILGNWGANVVSIAAMISIFAALNGSILSGSRVPYAMALDGQFFRAIGNVHPRWGTPGASIILLGGWSSVLVLSGKYDQLFTYVIFASAIFYALAASSVIVLRMKRPDIPRPYRVPGFPYLPIAFIAALAGLILSTLLKSPRESLFGLIIIASGLPLFVYWRRAARSEKPPRVT
ncbi:MAG TPA: amino acid permease [Bryobacteraceae bacterium]|jgi:APA family basic amino acid/polyamine antiporter|nr:amino acid permease [Bryobacteraceae bacterium]